MKPLAMAPVGQNFMTAAHAFPRMRAGLNSMIAALMMEYSAPAPSAVRNQITDARLTALVRGHQ